MMLKKVLTISILVICGYMGLQAAEEIPSNPIKKEEAKELTPGVMVCNDKEDECATNEDQKEEGKDETSALFSRLCDEHEEEQKLACKDCQ